MSKTNTKNKEERDRLQHPIGVVARRTGLKPDLIRAWERRYGVVTPTRSSTSRRLYSDLEIERLSLLSTAQKNGRRISQIAPLTNEQLREMIAEDICSVPVIKEDAITFEQSHEHRISAAIRAIKQLDAPSLEFILEMASVQLSRIDLFEHFLAPLVQRVGDLWNDGILRPVHEHLGTATLRTFIGSYRGAGNSGGGPSILITTPSRQKHELGALLAAGIAKAEGWNTTYLGPDLPAEEIAAGALQLKARVLALSIAYPGDDPHLGKELIRLRHLMGTQTQILAGGRSAVAYSKFLEEIDAKVITELSSFRQYLGDLRTQAIHSKA